MRRFGTRGPNWTPEGTVERRFWLTRDTSHVNPSRWVVVVAIAALVPALLDEVTHNEGLALGAEQDQEGAGSGPHGNDEGKRAGRKVLEGLQFAGVLPIGDDVDLPYRRFLMQK